MKTIAEFAKTTLIGGLLIILPVYVCPLLLAKAALGLLALINPPPLLPRARLGRALPRSGALSFLGRAHHS
jgi:hypothetical protein